MEKMEKLKPSKEDLLKLIEEEKKQQVEECAQKMDELLKKYNCGLRAQVTILENGQLFFTKEVYLLEK